MDVHTPTVTVTVTVTRTFTSALTLTLTLALALTLTLAYAHTDSLRSRTSRCRQVILFEPFYDSYPASVTMAGGVSK